MRACRDAAYWMAAFLHVLGWGVYYSVSRMLVANIGYSGVLIYAAAETLPTALSIPASSIAAARGYRRLILVGFLEAAALAGFAAPWPYSPLFVFAASAAWAVAGPTISSAILETGLSGVRLGAIFSSTALGWSLGGFVGPLIYTAFGLQGAAIIAAASIAVCYALLLPYAPPTASKPGGSRVGSLETLAYSLALSPLIAGMEASFALVMARLSEMLPVELYAWVLAGTGIASALGKPVAGILVDWLGSTPVYYGAIAAYSAWMYLVSRLDGVALAVAFLAPIYPFYEIGFYSRAARLLGERRASAAWAASYTAAGVIVLGLRWSSLGYRGTLVASAALAASSLLAIVLVERWISRRLCSSASRRGSSAPVHRVHAEAGSGAASWRPNRAGEGESKGACS